MVENFFNQKDYTRIFSCANCSKGFISKTKYNKPGFRDSEEYLCRYCGLESSIGDLVYESPAFMDFPSKYRGGMKQVDSNEEYQLFSKIWLTATSSPIVCIDDSDYEPTRDPKLFPMLDYLSQNQINKAKDNKVFDITEHCKYVNSDEGKRRILNRINYGDFGECPYCGTNLFPYGIRSKPFMRSYNLNCPKCSYARSGDEDGAYYHGWLDDLAKAFLSVLPSKYGASSFITPKDSIDLFEDLKFNEEESEILDFKEDYSINSKGSSLTDGAKKELRKDICSFANNKGGCIFIGVKEITSQKTELIGILKQEIYAQEFIDQILSSGPINPSISDVRLHKILYNNKWYVIIEIPESNLAPHFADGKIPYRFGRITKYFDTKDEWNNNKT